MKPWKWRSNTIMNITRKYAAFCLLAASCLLFACTSLTRSDRPSVTTWWLKPHESQATMATAAPVRKVSLSVTAVPGLDSDQILALSADATLRPFAGARWAGYLPELTASLIGRSLEVSGRFEFVPDRLSAGAASCDLQLEFTEFFAELDPGGMTTAVSVDVKGRFQCKPGEAVVFQSEAYVPVADNRMTVIVSAFQRALDHVTEDILGKI